MDIRWSISLGGAGAGVGYGDGYGLGHKADAEDEGDGYGWSINNGFYKEDEGHMAKHPLTVTLPLDKVLQLDNEAKKQGISREGLAAFLIAQGLKNHKPETKDFFEKARHE